MKMERNDPTHAGFTPPATGTARLSGNEVESLCLKAARGAGLSWGLAEEAGFAARWLYARGIDGPAALQARLDDTGVPPDANLAGGALHGRDTGPLCPIMVGAALSDLAAVSGGCNRAGPVDRPLLVLPFIHQVAAASNRPMVLEFSGGNVSVSAEGDVAGDLAALVSAEVDDIAIAPGFEAPTAAVASRGLAVPSRDTLARLNALAMLTYVPASAASRTDAGSADGDND